jgi:hypothetical protein
VEDGKSKTSKRPAELVSSRPLSLPIEGPNDPALTRSLTVACRSGAHERSVPRKRQIALGVRGFPPGDPWRSLAIPLVSEGGDIIGRQRLALALLGRN